MESWDFLPGFPQVPQGSLGFPVPWVLIVRVRGVARLRAPHGVCDPWERWARGVLMSAPSFPSFPFPFPFPGGGRERVR